MWEKLNYDNWISEKLEIVKPIIDNKKTRDDLKSLEFLMKTEIEWFSYEKILLLMDSYREYILPIVSDIDYEWISNDEVKNRIKNLKWITELDKLKISVVFFWYLLRD